MSLEHSVERTVNCATIQELIPEYAFGLTTPEENRLVEANLSTCPEAAATLQDLQQLQAEMRESVPQIEPPAALGNRLMAAINTPAPRRLPFAWLAAAAAIIALVLTNVYWMAQVNYLIQRHDELAASVNMQLENALVLTSANDLRWARLPSAQEGENHWAYLVWNGETGIIYARGLPPPQAGENYEVSLVREGQPIGVGTLPIDEDGNGTMMFHLTEPIDNYAWARITDGTDDADDELSPIVVIHGELADS